MPNQHADAAGIDGGDFFEIQDDAILILAEEFDHSGIETIERRAHSQAPFELDDLDSVDGFRLDVQSTHPLRKREWSAIPSR